MPETYREKISRILRDHQGYTGDGQGGVGDLPIGDRSTARKPIEKRDLRGVLLEYADVAEDAQASADSASDSAIEAALYDPSVRFKDVPDLLASNRAAKGEGTIWQAGSFLYGEAAPGATDHHLTTAGGVKLAVIAPGGYVHADQFGSGAAAVSAALNFTDARIVDLTGVPTELTAGIVVNRGDVTIRGLDISGQLPDEGISLEFLGSIGEAVPITANTVIGDNTVTIGGTTHPFQVDQFVRARSDYTLWYKSRSPDVVGGTLGEMCRIRNITGSAGAWVLEFYDDLEFPYTVAANGRIEPMEMLENITLESPKITGSVLTDNQQGLRFFACDKVRVIKPDTTDCDYLHMHFDACGVCEVVGGSSARAGEIEGLDYGIAASNGTYSLNVDGYEGREFRHSVTVGGSIGAVRYYRVANCRFPDSIDGGADAHPGSINAIFDNNDIICREGGGDGLVFQGLRGWALNNRISGGLTRHGIIYQPTISVPGVVGMFKARGNDISSLTGASTGIVAALDTQKTPRISLVDTSENTILNVDTGVRLTLGASIVLDDLRAQGNDMSDMGARGIHATVSGGTLSRWNLEGNTSDGVNEVYYMQEASGTLGRGRLRGNHAEDGTTAYRIVGSEGFTTDGANTEKNCTNFWSLSGNGYQHINELMYGSKTVDPVDLAPGARHTETVTVSGATLGDMVAGTPSHSTSLFGDVIIEVEGVVGTDTVRVHYVNNGSLNRNVTSGTLRVAVRKLV